MVSQSICSKSLQKSVLFLRVARLDELSFVPLSCQDFSNTMHQMLVNNPNS